MLEVAPPSNHSQPVRIVRYAAQRPGPEARLVAAALSWLPSRLGAAKAPSWVGCELSVGAGQPDLVGALPCPSWPEQGYDGSLDDARLLAYFKSVTRARPEVAARRTGLTAKSVSGRLESLETAGMVQSRGNQYQLTPAWRRGVPRIISIEAKVSKWREAVDQAGHNRLFAHESFVCLPLSTAVRVAKHLEIESNSTGVLGVDHDDSISIVRPAVRRRPVAWIYHYFVALRVLSTRDPCRSQ